ncbi:hypothetical protein ACN38_g6903 [Penicillium nordicum]|uniref:Uncharacterized protein n=1 Tax=Penicillium nordicum TaxID=229535 RepID=A0A0M9WF35_9EURO|nr:hypothetical protein ACN38_g6903 [Penicillium nordicum]
MLGRTGSSCGMTPSFQTYRLLCTSYLYLYLRCYPTSSSVIQSKGYTISYLSENLLFTFISSTLFHPFKTPKSPKSSFI